MLKVKRRHDTVRVPLMEGAIQAPRRPMGPGPYDHRDRVASLLVPPYAETTRRGLMARSVLGAILPAVSACQPAPPPSRRERRDVEATVYLIAAGWHTELALARRVLRGPLFDLSAAFPAADFLTFGWGERGYYMTRAPTAADTLQAMFPGPAVLLVTPVSCGAAMTGGTTDAYALDIAAADIDRLAAYVWAEFATTPDGRPQRIADGFAAGSAFYVAQGTYSLSNTCNTWTAGALRASGMPITVAGTVFADQVAEQVRALPNLLFTDRRVC